MRFVILTQYYPPEVGAAQVRLHAVAQELVRLGHAVDVATALPSYPHGRVFDAYRHRIAATETMDGATIRRVWAYPATGAGLKRLINYGSFTAASLWPLMRGPRPDVVLVESPPLFLSLPGVLAARLRRARLVFNVADLWPDSVRQLGVMNDGVLLRLAQRLEQWSYASADAVTAVTEGLRETLVREKGIAPERVLFLPNGVDAKLFRLGSADVELARELGLAHARVILYAGTHGYAHGIDTALHAAQRIRNQEPDICFVFIGAGSEKARLQALARTLELTNVRFLDPAPLHYIARLYSIAELALSTLRRSPLFESTRPAKILAAMASGVAIVYSGAGEGARLVESAGAGIVTPPEDPDALVRGIRLLLNDRATATRMGAAGRAFVERELDWSVLVANWLHQLDAVPEKHGY